MPSIPASAFVNVIPSVISAGGNATALNGLFLSTNTKTPIGAPLSFPSYLSVSNYYGSASAEAIAAGIYFNGFTNSNVKPGALFLAQYPIAPVSAYLRGGSLSALTLTQLKALSGTLALTIDGTVKNTASIVLSAATTFSSAAALITTALGAVATCTYDSSSSAFVITSATTGAASTIALAGAGGSLTTGLALTAATGAVLSQGAIAAVPSTFMAGIVANNQNWATFTTLFDPDTSGNANKQLFAAWTNATGGDFAYVAWDVDAAPTASSSATTSLGYLLKQTSSSGTICVYSADYTKAAFICGSIASIDFNQTNGRITLAYKSQVGLTADVTDLTSMSNLIANGYVFYVSVATANQQFTYLVNGQISGQFAWADSYIDQIWLNNAFQLALLTFLTQMKAVPYSAAGYAQVKAAMLDPIQQGLNFGMYSGGATLSSTQIASVNAAAGMKIDDVIAAQGWYLLIKPATSGIIASRASPAMTFFYLDTGSIQSISLASIEVQ
jgi:Protein of unknown function (DUF3383)